MTKVDKEELSEYEKVVAQMRNPQCKRTSIRILRQLERSGNQNCHDLHESVNADGLKPLAINTIYNNVARLVTKKLIYPSGVSRDNICILTRYSLCQDVKQAQSVATSAADVRRSRLHHSYAIKAYRFIELHPGVTFPYIRHHVGLSDKYLQRLVLNVLEDYGSIRSERPPTRKGGGRGMPPLHYYAISRKLPPEENYSLLVTRSQVMREEKRIKKRADAEKAFSKCKFNNLEEGDSVEELQNDPHKGLQYALKCNPLLTVLLGGKLKDSHHAQF